MHTKGTTNRYANAPRRHWTLWLCLLGILCLVSGILALLLQARASASLHVAGPAVTTLGAALLVLWGICRTRRTEPTVRSRIGWRIFRGVLAVGFLAVILSILPAYSTHIHNPGQLIFTAVSVAGLLGCALWPLFARVKPLRLISRIFAGLYGLLALAVLFLSLCMVAGALGPSAPDGATALVLGSKVSGETPSIDLQARINKAAAWLTEHPSSKAVACGGQGANESISEAEAIRRGLVSLGIDNSRILLEDRSTSTEENIRNAQSLLPKNGDVAVVTDDYHVFRARLLVKKTGMRPYAYPVAAKTPPQYFAAFYARELLALPVELLGLHGLIA